VLSLLDTHSLADLGINSLGHRLSILRAVWEMKLDQGVEIGIDEWRPSGMDSHLYSLPLNPKEKNPLTYLRSLNGHR
jgi:hypothetical protein